MADQARTLGTAATGALVVGGIIGTGIFTVPAAVAEFGPVAYPAFAVVTVGSILLALTFAALARRSTAGGGPAYGYAQEAFGPFAGFLSAWAYWIQGWTGQATISVAGAGYAVALIDRGSGSVWVLVFALVFLWVPVLVNVGRAQALGGVQIATTILKVVPLLAIGIAGIVTFDGGAVGEVTGDRSAVGALGPACAVLLFSFLGMEGAAVASDRVKDPARTIPRATVLGVLVVAGIYLVGLLGVQGTVPQAQLTGSTAPFADAARSLTGAGWVADVVSLVAIISAVGALNGWTMVNGEMVVTAARDDLFPAAAAKVTRGVPARAIVANTVLGTLLVLANQAGDFIGLFTTLALLSTFAYVFTYVLSMAAQLSWLARGHGDPRTAARDAVLALLALAFGIWMIGATGRDTVFAGVLMLLIGIPVYVLEQWRRTRAAGVAAARPA